MPEITVYSRNTCAPCQMVKRWLHNKQIPFTEKSVDDPLYAAEAYEKSGYSMVPIIQIGQEIVTGPNFGRMTSLLTNNQ